MCTCDELK
jgi:hypothetical protein